MATEQDQTDMRQAVLTALSAYSGGPITDIWAGPRSREISFTAKNAAGITLEVTCTVTVREPRKIDAP